MLLLLINGRPISNPYFKLCSPNKSKLSFSLAKLSFPFLTYMFCPICIYWPIRVYSYETPIRVWDNILSHIRINILFGCFISLQVSLVQIRYGRLIRPCMAITRSYLYLYCIHSVKYSCASVIAS